MTTVINRPWISSFPFQAARFSETQLEQIYKLTRNFVASLDLGCPSVKPVKKFTHTRDAYLAWVKDWKTIYRQLSILIREYKLNRKTIHFPKYTPEEQKTWLKATDGTNLSMCQHMNGMSNRHLGRLQETAMVMLNARYNAKLASAERRRRDLVSISGNATVSKTVNVGSSPTEVATAVA